MRSFLCTFRKSRMGSRSKNAYRPGTRKSQLGILVLLIFITYLMAKLTWPLYCNVLGPPQTAYGRS